jgi:RecG-like helicase
MLERKRLTTPQEQPLAITRLDAMVAARGDLPFKLTAGQERALGEVLSDLAGPGVMLRLLQGDVGCGKTIVAMLAMLAASGSGGFCLFLL